MDIVLFFSWVAGMSCGNRQKNPRALIAINNTPPTLYRARLLNNRSVLSKADPHLPKATYVLDLAHELKLERFDMT